VLGVYPPLDEHPSGANIAGWSATNDEYRMTIKLSGTQKPEPRVAEVEREAGSCLQLLPALRMKTGFLPCSTQIAECENGEAADPPLPVVPSAASAVLRLHMTNIE
jgi:hypothetical protein